LRRITENKGHGGLLGLVRLSIHFYAHCAQLFIPQQGPAETTRTKFLKGTLNRLFLLSSTEPEINMGPSKHPFALAPGISANIDMA